MPAVAPPHPDQTLPRPLAATTASSRHGYHRAYEVHAAGGPCQVQRVQVAIDYRVDGRTVVGYRQTYCEFFAFAGDAAPLVDTHDFDLVRDGWRQAVIVGLQRAHRAAGAALPAGEAELAVRKRFTIAPGAVDGASPRRLLPGASFGLLADGPGGRSRARLRVARGDGTWAVRDDLPGAPAGYPIAGRGAFTTDLRAVAVERFDYRFSTLTARSTDRGRYVHHRTA